MKTIFLMLLILSSVSSNKVWELSDRFVELREEGHWLVLFFAPWCVHCKNLEPIYAQVAQALHAAPIRVAKIDCSKFTEVRNKFGIEGFPTIIFTSPTKHQVYHGDRQASDIVKFAYRMLAPSVQAYPAYDTPSEPHLLHVGPTPPHYKTTATKLRPMIDFYATKSHPDLPPGTYLKQSNRFLEIKEQNEESLTAFIHQNRFPQFNKITRYSLPELMKTRKIIVMAVVEEDKLSNIQNPDQRQFLLEYEKFVGEEWEKFEGVVFGYTGLPDIAFSILLEKVGLPALLALNSSSHEHFLKTDGFGREEVEGWLRGVLEGKGVALGGLSPTTILYRHYYEGTNALRSMFKGNPILTCLIFGLPLGFLSIICCSAGCSEVLEDEDDEEEHEKHD